MLTTNGIGLDKRAAKLTRAGLDRINVSLDTVDAARFAHITRRDRLHDVLTGLEAAKAAGLDPVKVNAVLDPITGLDDAVALLRFCLDHGYQLRIIEQMPLDAGHAWTRGETIAADDVLATLRRHFELRPDATRAVRRLPSCGRSTAVRQGSASSPRSRMRSARPVTAPGSPRTVRSAIACSLVRRPICAR